MRDWKEDFDPIGMHKGILWEQAKGLLRAIVIAGGSVPGDAKRRTAGGDWRELDKRIEAFIKKIEDDGLHE